MVRSGVVYTIPVNRILAVGALLLSLVATASGGARSLAASAEGSTESGWLAAPEGGADHLLISEVLTGGAGASDEFIELYNPTAAELPLEGLELVYVSASGATISRKAEWPAGSGGIPAGGHLLIANGSGTYATLADVTYLNGLASTGGSVALRIQGAASAIDAVGWGTASSSWLEGTPAAVPPAGNSLERLPGGDGGSWHDSDDNALDFGERASPDPQNSQSPPTPPAYVTPSPSPSATPAPTVTLAPTPTPSSLPTTSAAATPAPDVVSIATARALPDGSRATVEGVALTDGAFTDGGGYLADASGGLSVLVADGTFPRGVRLRVSGELDDRYHQRTIRADAADVTVLGTDADPLATSVQTAAVGEAVEGRLVGVSAKITSAPSALSGGVAYDLDDGSGETRLVIYAATGIDSSGWATGTQLELVGVVGQRDSGGTGLAGYRLQPRDASDVLGVGSPPTPTPGASGPASTASPSPAVPGVMSIADARLAADNTRLVVRGVVTLPSSVLGEGTAAVQDASGGIILRIGDEAGTVSLGDLLEISGTRATKSGMETIRVSTPPVRLGSEPQPAAAVRGTGSLGEADEGRLLVLRGAVASAPRRSSAEKVYFDLDDGSGAARIYVSPTTGIETDSIMEGQWLEVTGVLGQETSGRQPERGYRLWPRTAADVRVTSAPAGVGQIRQGGAGDGSGGEGPGSRPPGPPASARPGHVPDLAPPRLAAPRLARAVPTHAAPLRAHRPVPAGEDARQEAALAATLAGGLLGIGGAAAAVRPGIVQRLRALVEGTAPAAGEAREDEPEAFRSTATASPIEEAVARLMPLSIMDGGVEQRSGRPEGAGARSAGRILPPT